MGLNASISEMLICLERVVNHFQNIVTFFASKKASYNKTVLMYGAKGFKKSIYTKFTMLFIN